MELMAKIRKTKTNLEAPEWDLSDLYAGADDPKIESGLAYLLKQSQVFEERYRGNLKQADPAFLLQALTDLEEIYDAVSRLNTYASLLASADTSNESFKILETKVESASTEIRNHLLFFDLELFEIKDEDFDELLGHTKLEDFGHYLGALKKWKPHRLSWAEERILNEKGPTSFDALYNIFQNFLAGMEFKVKIGGRIKVLVEQEVLHLLHSPDRGLRKEAADSFSRELSKYSWLFCDLLNYLVKDKATEDKLRAHQYPEERRHLGNEISKEAVDTLAEVAVENYPLTARHYNLKRRALGLKALFDYDRYAPLEESKRVIPYSEAKEIVLSAYYQFSPQIAALVKEFYDKRWVDAKVRKGKRGGAFCSAPSPRLHPYVFTNYQGSPRDVATEAHELGHGIHGMLARGNHYFDYDTPLTTAETASVFGEMLVFESLKNSATSDREKLFLIMQKVEDIIATVFRQVAMFRFEQRIHYAFREGGRVSQAALCKWWNEEHQAVFGNSLKLREEHGCWWMCVPHVFHYPFYVYAYAFGELLTLSFYARYKNSEKNFEAKYVKFLSAGGSRSPDELLSDFGINASDPNFWRGGIEVIKRLLEEAEELAKKVGL